MTVAPSWMRRSVSDCASDCASVLATTNSTPSRCDVIMLLTALHPAPPTPMTRIFGLSSCVAGTFKVMVMARLPFLLRFPLFPSRLSAGLRSSRAATGRPAEARRRALRPRRSACSGLIGAGSQRQPRAGGERRAGRRFIETAQLPGPPSRTERPRTRAATSPTPLRALAPPHSTTRWLAAASRSAASRRSRTWAKVSSRRERTISFTRARGTWQKPASAASPSSGTSISSRSSSSPMTLACMVLRRSAANGVVDRP